MGFFRAARWLCQKGFGLGEPCNSSKKLPFIGHSLAKALTSMISFGPTKTLCGRYYYHCHFTDGKTEVQRATRLNLLTIIVSKWQKWNLDPGRLVVELPFCG